MDLLVSTEWLAGELGAADLRVIDATIFLPNSGRDARAEYEAGHIPGARFMDLDEVVDSDNPAPHMLPPAHKFASRMQSLGLGDGNRFVVYDNSPLHSAARGWWMLRSFGAEVTIVEALDRIVAGEEPAISQQLKTLADEVGVPLTEPASPQVTRRSSISRSPRWSSAIRFMVRTDSFAPALPARRCATSRWPARRHPSRPGVHAHIAWASW